MENHATEVPARPRQLLDEIKITLPERLTGAQYLATATLEEPHLPTTEWPRLGAAASPDADHGHLVDLSDADDPVDFNLAIEDGETTLFEAAINAFHAGEFQRAESLFLEEAQRNLGDAPQRAAISYRQAALAAGQLGNMDASDHWMRLAGREYLRVTEDDRTPLPFIREAAVMAAKCFLSVENLNVASKGLRRAQAIESVIRADDDLMAKAQAEAPTPAPDRAPSTPTKMIERSPVPRSSPRVVGASGAPVLPRSEPDAGSRPDGTAEADPGWLRRLRHRRPARHPA